MYGSQYVQVECLYKERATNVCSAKNPVSFRNMAPSTVSKWNKNIYKRKEIRLVISTPSLHLSRTSIQISLLRR